MGMESFRVDLYANSHGNTDGILDCLKAKYLLESAFTRHFFRKIKIADTYYIKNIRLYVNCQDGSENVYISLEGCFSDYHNNLEDAFSIYSLLTEHFAVLVKLDVFLNEEYQRISRDDFIRTVRLFYKSNYLFFMEKYGLKNKPLRPGRNFYDYCRVHRIPKASFPLS